ncbi:hypothetical protein SSPO_035270 [Streptomyces antimycoticus]|uniref:Type I restriction modification DNA specificity domain-containing protein n=1 Tax=Streptomyces antimycoticus TaxID=68175 RepID=A0A499UVJ0_9ACTN|nr:restriction endonuclease subunit S [Streptomyces antimycoticus]BBJ40809.1 hypothetical protein SSPO_035270 [Streptomyces antimycoticus]
MRGEVFDKVPLSYYLSGPIRNGYSPSENQDWTGMQMLGLGCLTPKGFQPRQLKNAPAGIPLDHSAMLSDGDILMSRANTRELVGLAGTYRDIGTPCIYPDLMMRLCPSDLCIPEFLEVLLQSSSVRRRVIASAQGTSESMVKISAGTVQDTPVPLVPLAEQRRIVEALDAVTASRKSIETSIAKHRVIRSEVMRQFFHDKSIPRLQLGLVAKVSSGSTPSRACADYWRSGTIPWVRTAEVNFSEINATKEHVTHEAVARTGLKVHPKNTVLLAMYGEGVTRGRSAILGTEATVNQATAAISCDPKRLDYRYLYYWLELSYEKIRKIGHGSNQTNLSGSLVESLTLPLPTLKGQMEFIEPLRALDEHIGAETDSVTKLNTLRQGVADDFLAAGVRFRDAP